DNVTYSITVKIVGSGPADCCSSSGNVRNNPGSFSATVSDITTTTATVSWTTSNDLDGDNVTYSITLEGQVLGSGLTVTNANVTGLDASTMYSGVITASDGNGGESTAPFSFTTSSAMNSAPGSFAVTVSDITTNSADLSWTAAEDPDGDDVTYKIMLAGSEISSGETGLAFSFTGLDPSSDYEGRVIAEDGNGGTSEDTFMFTTATPASCSNDNSTDQNNRNCDMGPDANTYNDANVNGAGDREVVTNGIPTHEYGNQIPNLVSELDDSEKTYRFDNTPSKAGSSTSITQDNGRPEWRFGVATNGVAIDPAPAEPFIFVNPNTMEFNWDWVFEPNNNMNAVGLDCAIAHVQPDGLYHYHGDMGIYAEELSNGISTGTAPSEPLQVGWAADGYPILYYYGPTADGSGIELLTSSYRIKAGERPGDGVSEPCGTYNGKYTNDYEFVNGAGDLDECNGIDRSITLSTGTYDYFYVITAEFPVISRCLVGDPNMSFKIGG
ncbi:MAG: YHYH protein, partial [Bacteroidota bacterium]